MATIGVGYVESFNPKLSDVLSNGEIIYSLKEAKIPIGAGRRHYTAIRPHSALRWRLPAPADRVSPTARWLQPPHSNPKTRKAVSNNIHLSIRHRGSDQ
jgi:putative transposase